MAKKFLAVLAAAFFAGAFSGLAGDAADTMTNADVVSLVEARTAPGVIVERIKDARNNFDLSNEAVIALKERGVPDEVLAAMLVSSARLPATAPATGGGLRPGAGGNLPMRGFGAGSGAFQAPDLAPPSLPGGEALASGFPGMESLDLPGLPGMDSLDDPAGFGGIPGLPSLPATAPAAATGTTATATVESTPMPAPVELTPPAPIQAGDLLARASNDFSLPPVDFGEAANDFYSAPVPTAAPAQPGVTAAPAKAAAEQEDPDKSRYEEAKKKFEKEIANVMAEAPEKKTSAVAWMLANQEYTLDLLRETMVKAPRPEMEAAAVYALGRMRDAEALPEIRRRLVNRSRIVRETAAEALSFMEDMDAITAAEKALTQRVDPMDGLIRLVGHARLVRASDNLGKILADSSTPANRVAAAWALTQLGRAGGAAWPAMKKALVSDSNPDVRREAVRAVSAFHDDKESGKLLESACRKDPEVRKIILEELANYRESIPFLVSVLNLKADQISTDERETARATLFKLTGEDFSLDGPRWKKWLADNRTRLGLPDEKKESDGKIPPGMKMGPAHLAGGRPRQVDVRSWGIVADPMEIPLAPEVDDAPATAHVGPRSAGGALPVPPPGFAGGPAGMGGMGGMSGMGGMGGGGMGGRYDDDEDYGPPPGGPAGMGGMGGMGGGMFGGGGFGGGSASAAGSGMGGGAFPPPPAGMAGGYDEDEEDYGPPASGGGALSGMRLPLPSGLMGAGGGDDAPPIPVGARSMGPAGSGIGTSGLGGMTGLGGSAGGMSSPMGGADDYSAPDASFSGGGMDSYSADSYSGSADYGSSYSGGGVYDSYSSGAGSVYSSADTITLPTPDYTPLSLDAYVKTDVIGETADDFNTTARVESTGDLIPNLPIETTTVMGGSDDWQSATSASSFSGGADFEESTGAYAAGGYDDGEDFDDPSFSGSLSGGAAATTVSANPVVAPLPAAGAANEITFPGDRTSFGLGEPMFNEYGQPNGGEGVTEMSAPAGTAGMLPPPGGSAPSGLSATAVVESGAGLALPPPAAMGMGQAAGGSDDFDFDSPDSDFYESAGGQDFDDGGATGGSYASGGYDEDMSAYDAGGSAAIGSGSAGGYEESASYDEDFDEDFDEGYETAEGGYDEEEGYGADYGSGVEAVSVPGGVPVGSGVAGGSAVQTSSSPGAASLNLPARKRRKQHTESAIVSHTPPAPAAGMLVGGGDNTANVTGASNEYERQAIRQGDSVLVTGPFKILDEEGRTTAIVMNADDQLLPQSAFSAGETYINLDDTDPFALDAVPVVGAQTAPVVPVPAPAPAQVRAAPPTSVTADVTVESSPSQRPGRNFRPKK